MTNGTDQWDAIVVGAGVAGALAAWRLASQGMRVLILEAGPEPTDRLEMVGAFARAAEKIPSAPYTRHDVEVHAPYPKVTDKSNGHYIQAGPDAFKSTYERLGGGSTWHWLGNVPRLLPNDFKMRSTYGVGVDWPITYDDLEPYYAEAERQLGVSGDTEEWSGLHGAWRSTDFPMPQVWPTYGDKVVQRHIAETYYDEIPIRLRVTPQARNSVPYQDRPPCAGNSSCVPICPIAAKYDATVHLNLAKCADQHGGRAAEVRYQSVVKRLVPDHATGNIDHVVYDHWKSDDTRETRVASARVYLLAAHAIETPLLILESGLASESPVGRYLMDHPQGYGAAVLADPVFPFRGPPVTSGIDAFRDGAFRSHRAAFRVSIGNDAWGRLEPIEETIREQIFDRKVHGDNLRNAINRRVTRMLRMSYSTEMLPDAANTVTIGDHDAKGNPRPCITFSVPEYNIRAFNYAKGLFRSLFSSLNGENITFSHPDTKFSGAGHIMGTCRMGVDHKNSVVDPSGRLHDHRNLFILGASVFPTGGTANPTLTVAALSLRTAEVIKREFRN